VVSDTFDPEIPSMATIEEHRKVSAELTIWLVNQKDKSGDFKHPVLPRFEHGRIHRDHDENHGKKLGTA
jgi:hypothetical protein